MSGCGPLIERSARASYKDEKVACEAAARKLSEALECEVDPADLSFEHSDLATHQHTYYAEVDGLQLAARASWDGKSAKAYYRWGRFANALGKPRLVRDISDHEITDLQALHEELTREERFAAGWGGSGMWVACFVLWVIAFLSAAVAAVAAIVYLIEGAGASALIAGSASAVVGALAYALSSWMDRFSSYALHTGPKVTQMDPYSPDSVFSRAGAAGA